MTSFDHERLHVYQVALGFLSAADEAVAQLPPGRAYLADQLHRAATSVVLNIAEGAGEFSRRDKARFYRMALRSATECAAILDVSVRLKLVADDKARSGREMLLRIVSMLVPLVKRLTQSGTGSGTGTGTGYGTGSGIGSGTGSGTGTGKEKRAGAESGSDKGAAAGNR